MNTSEFGAIVFADPFSSAFVFPLWTIGDLGNSEASGELCCHWAVRALGGVTAEMVTSAVDESPTINLSGENVDVK